MSTGTVDHSSPCQKNCGRVAQVGPKKELQGHCERNSVGHYSEMSSNAVCRCSLSGLRDGFLRKRPEQSLEYLQVGLAGGACRRPALPFGLFQYLMFQIGFGWPGLRVAGRRGGGVGWRGAERKGEGRSGVERGDLEGYYGMVEVVREAQDRFFKLKDEGEG